MSVIQLAAVVAIVVGAIAGCGSSDSHEVANLQAQLDEANARADAAEAGRDELAEQLDAAGTTPTTSVDSGADTGDTAPTTATEPTVADTPDTTTAPATSAPATTAAPVGGIAAPRRVPVRGRVRGPQRPPTPRRRTRRGHRHRRRYRTRLVRIPPVVVRNNTADAVGQIDVTGRARNNGDLVGSGSSQGFEPPIVQPGEIAWGYVYFDFGGVPAGTTFELSVSTDPPDDNFVGAPVIEVANTGTSIVGVAGNDTPDPISGPVSVSAACFDTAGNYTGTENSFTDEDEIPAGGSASFQVDLRGDVCDIGLVGASGFSF